MKKGKLFFALLLVTCMVLTLGVLFAGCKPGYAEVWEPIEPYNYEWNPDNGDLDEIKSRVNADCIREIKADREKFESNPDNADKPNIYDPAYLLSQIDPMTGAFKNIDYKLDTRAFWPPLDHLKYVLYLQVARNDNTEGNPYYMSKDIETAVTNAMANWIQNKYYCEWNWWFNEVGVGMYLPNIVLLGITGIDEIEIEKLGDDANKTNTEIMLANVEKTLLNVKPKRFRLYERNCNESGGNLADQALSTLKFCLAKGDGNTIMWVTKQIENELRPFPPFNPAHHRWDAEGIKEDWSFQQHDQMIYYGGYGEVMLDGFYEYIKYTEGTQFALSNEKINFYAKFIVNGISFATRGGYRDISASGRGIARQNGLKGIYTQMKKNVLLLLELDEKEGSIELAEDVRNDLLKLKSDRIDTVEAGLPDKGATGHRYFYESDYGVFNNAKYMATVRHASERTRIFEYLNGENPLGYYAGLGATFFYIDGDEYFNMPAVFDWNKMPGTTTRQGHIPTMNQDFSYNSYNNTKYVGGVSNGKVGASYIRLDKQGVIGRKAYFMFEDGVVCLGSDIRSIWTDPVLTNINQTSLDGDVIVRQNGNVVTNQNVNGKVDYIYHDKIGYITNNNIDLHINKGVTGDWKRIDERGKSRVETKDVFMLDIPHGVRPNTRYDYTVLMNTTPEALSTYASAPTLITVANTKSVQAVYDKAHDVLQVVFHKGGKLALPNGDTLKVSDGCVLILENVNGKSVLTIASHDYETRDMTVTIGNVEKSITVGKKPIVVEI